MSIIFNYHFWVFSNKQKSVFCNYMINGIFRKGRLFRVLDNVVSSKHETEKIMKVLKQSFGERERERKWQWLLPLTLEYCTHSRLIRTSSNQGVIFYLLIIFLIYYLSRRFQLNNYFYMKCYKSKGIKLLF